MKTAALVLAALAAFFSPGIDAQVAIQRGQDRVVLTMEPCPEHVQALVKPEYRNMFRQAFAMIKGMPMDACWIVASDTSVVVVFADGDTSELPMAEFKSVPSI